MDTGSVLMLINELCKSLHKKVHRHDRSPSKITTSELKSLRRKAYSILLKSRNSPGKKDEYMLNPFLKLVWYSYLLKLKGETFRSKQLSDWTDKIAKAGFAENHEFRQVLLFLLHRADKDPLDDDASYYLPFTFGKLDLLYKDPCNPRAYPVYEDKVFQPEKYMLEIRNKGSLEAFGYVPVGGNYPCSQEPGIGLPLLSRFNKICGSLYSSIQSYDHTDILPLENPRDLRIPQMAQSPVQIDEGYVTPTVEQLERNLEIIGDKPKKNIRDVNIWEEALKITSVPRHHTWESLGIRTPKKEKPFLKNSCTGVHLFWHLRNMDYLGRYHELSEEYTDLLEITLEHLRQHIKYLLQGITSTSFPYCEENRSFLVASGLCLNTLNPSTVRNCVDPFSMCGKYYKELKELISSSGLVSRDHNLVFKTVINWLGYYLGFYYSAVLMIPTGNNTILSLHNHIHDLRYQLQYLYNLCILDSENCISLICKIYYHTSLTQSESLTNMMYSLLEAVCRVYFRFLEEWIFEGKVPCEEEDFFIQENLYYIKLHDRTYWKNAFMVSDKAVPGFLSSCKNDILTCGKTINLLKLCCPQDPLCNFLSRKRPKIPFCLSLSDLENFRNQCIQYEEEIIKECGPPISVSDIEEKIKKEQEGLQQTAAEAHQRRLSEIKKKHELEQASIQQKKHQVFLDNKQEMERMIQRKIQEKEKLLEEERKALKEIEEKHKLEDQMKEEERQKLIQAYNKMSEAAEKRQHLAEWRIHRMQLNEKRVKYLKEEVAILETAMKTSPDISPSLETAYNICNKENIQINNTTYNNQNLSSRITEFSTKNDTLDECDNVTSRNINTNTTTFGNFDINDNFNNVSNENEVNMITNTILDNTRTIRNQTKITQLTANAIKNKVLREEFGIDLFPTVAVSNKNATLILDKTNTSNSITTNENKKINSAEILKYEKEQVESEKTNLDKEHITGNENDRTNLNNKENIKEDEMTINLEAAKNVSMDLQVKGITFTNQDINLSLSNPNDLSLNELNSSHYSLDSSPENESTDVISQDKKYDITWSATCKFDNIFSLPNKKPKHQDLVKINQIDLDFALKSSVDIILQMQMRQANCAVLKHFLVNLNLLSHLESLHNFYFMLNGEFGRTLMTSLFHHTYSVSEPRDLVNRFTLNSILREVLQTTCDINGERLGFIVSFVPERFQYSAPDLFKFLSLQYKVDWPLNIIITSKHISRYECVFNLLLKVGRVSWELEENFRNLKSISTIGGSKQHLQLMSSPQYHRLHLCRHDMTHFVRSVHNYLTTTLRCCWEVFRKNLNTANTINELHSQHVRHIRTILFRCLLVKDAEKIISILMNVFEQILKFHGLLRIHAWTLCETGMYKHPKYDNLMCHFSNYQQLSHYWFQHLVQLEESGYYPEISELISVLDMNDYYRKK